MTALNIQQKILPFAGLALGARFSYQGSERVWIKISNEGRGVIAEYDDKYISHENWNGQAICSALDDEDEKLMIVFVA